jgi:hypothetical protein
MGTYNLTHYFFSNVGLHPDFSCNGFLNPHEPRKVEEEQLKWSAKVNCKDEQRAQKVQGRRGWGVCQIIRPHDTLFISPDKKPRVKENIALVQHEYGHTVQLERIGLIPYLFGIAYPSMTNDPATGYYDQPWEVTADMFGGVNRTHAAGAEEAGEAYLAELENFFPNLWEKIKQRASDFLDDVKEIFPLTLKKMWMDTVWMMSEGPCCPM